SAVRLHNCERCRGLTAELTSARAKRFRARRCKRGSLFPAALRANLSPSADRCLVQGEVEKMTAAIIRYLATACLLGAFWASPALAGPTLDAVKARGMVHCGVNTGVPGLSFPDSTGRWRGLDVDFCRAIAVALFGDPE